MLVHLNNDSKLGKGLSGMLSTNEHFEILSFLRYSVQLNQVIAKIRPQRPHFTVPFFVLDYSANGEYATICPTLTKKYFLSTFK